MFASLSESISCSLMMALTRMPIAAATSSTARALSWFVSAPKVFGSAESVPVRFFGIFDHDPNAWATLWMSSTNAIPVPAEIISPECPSTVSIIFTTESNSVDFVPLMAFHPEVTKSTIVLPSSDDPVKIPPMNFPIVSLRFNPSSAPVTPLMIPEPTPEKSNSEEASPRLIFSGFTSLKIEPKKSLILPPQPSMRSRKSLSFPISQSSASRTFSMPDSAFSASPRPSKKSAILPRIPPPKPFSVSQTRSHAAFSRSVSLTTEGSCLNRSQKSSSTSFAFLNRSAQTFIFSSMVLFSFHRSATSFSFSPRLPSQSRTGAIMISLHHFRIGLSTVFHNAFPVWTMMSMAAPNPVKIFFRLWNSCAAVPERCRNPIVTSCSSSVASTASSVSCVASPRWVSRP